ncbi:MAG: Asp-tRNA(Asn)/Glu-tRNA(Gln) amidotransferase subunit GatB [Gammaproteobacteria bacterium]|nr:Asp-tRNA(Asn)/Glu-tRNA(Gln) amidotransferase subunit GatB [Gammaproteobacteria bacterium]
MSWETVIGLEVHLQLATRSKLFSGAATAFGAAPNTQACAIDLALPGTLPLLNKAAVEMAIRFGLAVDAAINPVSVFERKNYFYPDLPKGYQTTQLAHPIVGPGHLDIELADGREKRIRIHHAHLEEDAGKSLHEDFHGLSGIDLNRAGTPLIEIVTEPDLRNAEEAVAFAKKLHAIVTALGISDGDMSQGSMRFDVNVSVRRPGEPLGTRTETKNLNSFRFMERAIAKEVARQIGVLEDGGRVLQETRLYDGDTDSARAMRSKEEANDYRYFPCPDLLPVHVAPALIDQLRASQPELPDARRARFVAEHGLSDYDAGQLAADTPTAHYFEAAAKASGDPKLAANWLMGEIAARLNSTETAIAACPVSPAQLGGLLQRILDRTISNAIARQVFDALWNGASDADAVIEAKGLKQVSDSGAIAALVDQVLVANPKQVADYRAAPDDKKAKMFGFFVGQAMKASGGKVNPQQLNALLAARLNG